MSLQNQTGLEAIMYPSTEISDGGSGALFILMQIFVPPQYLQHMDRLVGLNEVRILIDYLYIISWSSGGPGHHPEALIMGYSDLVPGNLRSNTYPIQAQIFSNTNGILEFRSSNAS